jgi:class 3 adenylate cyclase
MERSAPDATTAQGAGAAVPFAGTVTILFSDFRGFTDCTEQFGDAVAYRLLVEHNGLIRAETAAHDGVVVKTHGDSFMVAFRTARAAIQCAIAIQQAIAEANRLAEGAQGTGPRIAVGIGINTGEPIEDGGDYFGSMVNLASRICAAAGAGQILVTEATRFVAGRIEGVDYADLGLHELKGFPEARRLSEVVWGRPDAGADGAPPAEEDLAEIKAAVRRALGVLNRVLALTHAEEPAFPPLLECQAKAGDCRLLLSRALTARGRLGLKEIGEATAPFEGLLTLVTDRDILNEAHWAELDAAVARAFGRALVTAAARGRLVAAPTAEPARPRPEARPSAAAPPAAEGEEAADRSPLSVVARPPAPPPPPDPRAAGVRWWTAAFAAWSQWKASGLGWVYAVRTAATRHPHVLSVPLRASADYDQGRLAAGYFFLHEHVESQSPGFLRTAVDRAIEAARGSTDDRLLGPALYRLLVDDGGVRTTYPAFVRDVIIAAIPTPGLWADAGIVEHEDVTQVVTRVGSRPGDPQERTERVTDAAERVVPRCFELALQPLTTRLVYVKAGPLKRPREVILALTVDGEPSDRGWYMTLKTGLQVRSEPRRLPLGGLTVSGVGRESAGTWVALFNPDPDEIVSFALTVTVKPPRPAGRARSPFASGGEAAPRYVI